MVDLYRIYVHGFSSDGDIIKPHILLDSLSQPDSKTGLEKNLGTMVALL